MAVSKEDVIANLRAIIISSKGGLRLADVRADYQETFGADIPLRSLGYNSLEEFFKVNSDNFNLLGSTVTAVVKSSSVHIASLVNRQNASKKHRRSKLSNKPARHLRKPRKSSYAPVLSSSMRRPYDIPPRFARQNSTKDGPPPLMNIHWTHVEGKTSPGQDEVHKFDKTKANSDSDKSKGENNLKGLKVITRTVKNEIAFGAKESENVRKTPVESPVKEEVLFEDFEDLNISNKAQSRLLKFRLDKKYVTNNGTPNGGALPNSVNSNPPTLNSPFGRSLANNSQQEILSAKRSAQVSLDNNNIDPNVSQGTSSLAEFVVDLEDDAKYEHKLKQFCLDKGLIMPVYSVIVRETKNQAKCYGCKLTIGDFFQVSTYPVETHSEMTARELASKKAFNQLTLNRNFPSLFYETENVVKLVEQCLKKNLPDPIFKSIECHPKNEPKYFICKVRIGEGILLSSYPMEAQDEMTARDIAAKKALDHLSSDQKSPTGISKGDSVLSQIFNIIKLKEYGVWSNKLPALYAETYNEELPSNWFSLVEKSSKFEITHVDKVGHIIRVSSQLNDELEDEEQPVLAPLKVPESNQWEVYITNVITSAEIWCRLIGKEYNEVYDAMMTKLELQPPTVTVKTPVVGQVYLVNLEHSWNRVRVTEIHPDKEEVSAFLIDIGVDEVVKISQLFHLDKDFFSVAPQAILLSLNELDCLAECEELQSALFHTLLGNVFIAEVVAILDEGGNVSSVTLWDTSTDEDINVNSKLLGNVIQTIKSPSLPAVGLVKEMYVSYVDDNGYVYVQNSKQSVHFVNCIISTKMKNCAKLVPVINNKVDSKKLYVTRYDKNGLFYRAKVLKNLDPNTVTVKFIDYGHEQRTSIDDLFDLEETAIDLATIPSQAIRVKLFNLTNFNEKVLNKLRDYIMEQNVLVKVIQMIPASVEVFKRSQSDGTLSSINNKINNDGELQIAGPPTRKKSYVVGLESTLSRHLPMPNIPPVGSYFNVFVTLAAHPGLFNVQPLATQSELMELMFRLQEKCEATFSKPLTPEEFKIGELYAVKHADDFWYRAYAHAVISSTAYTVCLCDFGDFVIVPAEKLMPLPSEFKTFPYQAIRAYLAGIAPVNKDWSALDCVDFRELVIEKQFVSQVVEINRDLKNPNYISLGLMLVDTSTSEDLYIHQLLTDYGSNVHVENMMKRAKEIISNGSGCLFNYLTRTVLTETVNSLKLNGTMSHSAGEVMA